MLDGEPALLKPAADELAAELRLQAALVKSVFFKIDLALLRDRAPLCLPLSQLEELRARLAQQRPLIEPASRIHNLPELVAAIEQGFARPELALDPVAVNALLAGVSGFFSEWRGFVADPARRDLGLPAGLLAAGAEVPAVVRSGGYLTSRDGRLPFLFVQPTSASDDATFLRPLLFAVRAAGERVLKRHPLSRPGPSSISSTVGKQVVRMTAWRRTGILRPCWRTRNMTTRAKSPRPTRRE